MTFGNLGCPEFTGQSSALPLSARSCSTRCSCTAATQLRHEEEKDLNFAPLMHISAFTKAANDIASSSSLQPTISGQEEAISAEDELALAEEEAEGSFSKNSSSAHARASVSHRQPWQGRVQGTRQ